VERNETARIEAFSDGVFAIAITLLIIEVHVPAHRHADTLGHELLAAWPSYFGYLTSFLTIGVMWLNHHHVFTLLDRYDHTHMLLNLVLLLLIAFLPFPTAVLARFIGTDGAQAAVALYGGTLVLVAMAFFFWWRYASSGRRLIAPHVPQEQVDATTRAYNPGTPLYVAALGIGLLEPWAGAAAFLALAVFYALPWEQWNTRLVRSPK
jgi:uncharacterized membrane protein